MEFKQLPCVYLPTQVVMVDDNMSFLENIRLTIPDYKNVILFSDPLSAIDSLLKYESIFNASELMKNLDCDEIDEENALSIDYKKFSGLVNVTQEISVLVVDYSMPEMNGIDFFNQIKSLKVKKIMLTGEADNQIAVSAFNEGLIDKFIVKGGSKVNETLCHYISELKRQYFIDTKLNQLVSINSPVKGSDEYTKLANNWLKNHSIIQFYQINQHGSLMGLDKDNNYRCFYLLNSESFNGYLEIAEYQSAKKSLVDILSNKISMPVFITDENMKIPVNQWDDLLHPIANCFEFNSENYYCCYLNL